MGFYDCRCMVTGVSLIGSMCAGIVLLPNDMGYLPLTPVIFGQYDRYGSIDGIREDEVMQAVLDFFRAKHQDGSFVVDAEYLKELHRDPFSDVETLLWCFERNINDGAMAWLAEQPPVLALICGVVWDAIVGTPPPDPVMRTRAQRLLQTLPAAQELYSPGTGIPEEELLPLMAVDAFIEQHGIAWHPDKNAHQHDSDEIVAYLATARDRFRATPAILDALNQYEADVRDLLEE